jgi:hypothetical protein
MDDVQKKLDELLKKVDAQQQQDQKTEKQQTSGTWRWASA